MTFQGNPVIINPDLGPDDMFLINPDKFKEFVAYVSTSMKITFDYPGRLGYITSQDDDLEMDIGL